MTNTRWPVWLLLSLLVVPVVGGAIAVVLPAFYYSPALGFDAFSLTAFEHVFDTLSPMRLITVSLGAGVLSTLFAVLMLVTILATYFTGDLSTWDRRFRPLLVMPHAAAAIALGFIIAPSGMIIRVLSPSFTGLTLPPAWPLPNDTLGAVMTFALGIKELPFLLLVATAALVQVQRKTVYENQVKLANTLGYTRFAGFVLLIWPQLYRLIRLPVIAVLVYTGASVEIPLILGPDTTATLSLAMLSSLNNVDLTERFNASALGLLQLFISLLSVIMWLGFEALGRGLLAYLRRPDIAVAVFSFGPWLGRFFSYGVFGLMTFAIMGLLLLSVAGHWPFSATLPTSLTATHWSFALSQLNQPIINSVAIGLAVSLFSVVLCIAALETLQGSTRLLPWLTVAHYIPLLIPMIVFMYGAALWVANIIGPQRWLSVFILHFVVVAPYVWLALSQPYLQIDKRLIAVAKTLGAKPFAVFWKIKLPLLKNTFFSAFALGVSISFSQYLPTLLGSGGEIHTVTTEAVALASSGSRRLTAVYALVQIALPALVFGLAALCSKNEKSYYA